MRRVALLLALLACTPVAADIVVATQIIRPNAIISANSVTLQRGEAAGVYSELESVVGLEARNALYPGRPVRFDDVGQPALVERNQVIVLIYDNAGLSIRTDARSLDRAGAGERLKVMNLNSRTTVTGTVMPDGTVRVMN